ncbi:MAG: hypothetical protein KC501_17405 [Myxococcales bacterium]|nr:hypothetical protein [Myxococcales bacterium]
MRRHLRWVAPAALPLALALGCSGGDDAAGDTEGDEGSSSEDGGPPLPSFSEPASGRLSLASTRSDDVSLEVLGISLGETELLLDGIPMGTLGEGSIVGRLDTSALVLFLHGSMIPGTHRMTLRTAAPSGTKDSEIVVVDISTDASLVPTATLDDAPALAGTRVHAFGHDEGGVLMVIEPAEPAPRLHLLPRGPTGWDPAERRSVSTPGLELGPGLDALPIAALRHHVAGDDPGRVRVAWRVGRPGTRIDLLDLPWDEASPEPAPSASLTVSDALAGRPAEWAELQRPWLVGDRLIAELLAPIDVEAARPGDRAVVHARIADDGTAIDPPQRLMVGSDLVDLDDLGPAIDLVASDRGAPAPFTLRVAQREPVVLDLDPSRGLLQVRASVIDGADVEPFASELPLVTVTGAFGSRTVAELRAGGEEPTLQVGFFDDLSGAVDRRILDPEALPDLASASGGLAPGSIDGLTVFLVPLGAELPVHAVYAKGDDVGVAVLDELHCESVALGTAGGRGTLPLACARDGQVWLGELSTTESGT